MYKPLLGKIDECDNCDCWLGTRERRCPRCGRINLDYKSRNWNSVKNVDKVIEEETNKEIKELLQET